MSIARFVLRFIAITSFLAALIAFIVLIGLVASWNLTYLEASSRGAYGETQQIVLWVFAGGVVLGLAIGLIDLLYSMWSSAGRKNALGINVIVQVALAAVLLLGVNAFSYQHYHRWDLTRERAFTINPAVASELAKLSGKTTVIVYRQYKSDSESSKRHFVAKADAQISEKVEDLVDQLREYQQFEVIVLDPNDKDYGQTLATAEKDFPKLSSAIKSAPDSSIFFCDADNVQRMSFGEFYLLDKSASEEADGGRGNLVLLNQGIEPFARHVLAIEEKKPRIGVCVIHEYLATSSTAGGLTLSGMGKSLEANGFEVRDIILKRWGEEEPQPAAYTFDESRLDQLQEELSELGIAIPVDRQQREKLQSAAKMLRELTLAELSQQFREDLRGQEMTEEIRKNNLNRLDTLLTAVESELTQLEEDRRKDEAELSKLLQKETVVEGRRVSDVKLKSSRLFDDCDMLIIPRMTIIDLLNSWRINPRLYRLSDPQVAAIRSFMRSGKPVLFMFGPTNEPANAPSLDTNQDNLESLLGELGIIFGDQTILFNVEQKAFAYRRIDPLGGGQAIEIPPLDFASPVDREFGDSASKQNPLRESLQLIARSAGGKLDLAARYPRPVYFSSLRSPLDYKAEFLLTDPACWNEKKPFPDRNYTPRFDPDKPTDPTKGTLNEERHGPFPVGVAAEVSIPPEWIDDKYRAMKVASMVLAGAQPTRLPADLIWETVSSSEALTKGDKSFTPAKVRVAAIGHGGLFVSADASQPEFPAAKEQLLLQTVNWLFGREDRLPRSDHVWQYPRVALSPIAYSAWKWGSILGGLMVFGYLGVLVAMFRLIR